MHVISWYRKKIEEKLEMNCKDVLEIISKLSSRSSVKENVEASTFFLKMEADYNRYMCEFVSGDK